MTSFAKVNKKVRYDGEKYREEQFYREPEQVETGKRFYWEGAPEQ